MPEPVRLWLACALLAFLFTWQGTVGGKVFAPLGLLFHFEPWRSLAIERPPEWDVLVWDGTAQFYVWRDLVRTLWLSGEIPLWNPYELCGIPLLANSQSAPFYPPHLMAVALPTELAIGWLAWFHLFWAGVGLALWGYRNGWHFWACLVSASAWMFSTFFVAWLQMSSVPATLCWFGWVLLGLQHLHKVGWRGVWAVSLPIGMMLLGGHLQFAFYGLVLAVLYAVWLAWANRADGWRESARFLLLVGVGLLLGFLLSAVQTLPALEYSTLSHRANIPTEAGYSAYVRNALPLFHLVAVWLPDVYGHPRDGSYWGAVHYAELALAVGALPLLWAFVGLARRGEGWFWAGIALVALLVALGSPLTRLLYFWLPGFSATGSPARVLCLWAFALAVLAGWGFHSLSQRGISHAKWGFLMWVLLLVGAIGCAYWLLPDGVSREPLTQGIVVGILRAGILLLLAGGLLLALQRKVVSARMGVSLLALMSILEPFALGYRYPLYAEREQAFPAVPLLQEVPVSEGGRIAVLNTRWSLYEAPPATLPPNTATAYRLSEVGGYDSLLPRWAKQMLDIVNGTDSAPPENGNMQFVKTLSLRLRWLRVEQVLTPTGWEPIEGEAPPLYLGKAQVIENPSDWVQVLEACWRERTVALSGDLAKEAIEQYGEGVAVADAQIEWKEYRATQVRLRVVNPALQTAWLLLSDTYYPGWRAWVDGEPVPLLQANLALRAIPVLPGEHEVRMAFLPMSFLIGALGSVIAGLMVLGIGVVGKSKR